ncbi:hypothetical protein GCM10010129_21360 [Streptomyces fumigatiscleroticus]|nr:hypothetical protein GCM10010129_21360 [Streptomyces fumigatiscleroticus]
MGEQTDLRPHPAVEKALRRMELGPCRLANLEADFDEPGEDGEAAPAASGDQGDGHCLLLHLERLSHLVVRTLSIDDLSGPLLAAMPVSPVAHFALAPLPEQELVRLPGGVSFSVSRHVSPRAGAPSACRPRAWCGSGCGGCCTRRAPRNRCG